MDFKELANMAKEKAVEAAKNIDKDEAQKLAEQCKDKFQHGDKKDAAMTAINGLGNLFKK